MTLSRQKEGLLSLLGGGMGSPKIDPKWGGSWWHNLWMGNIEMHKASMQLESRRVLNLITQHPHCSNIKVLQGKMQDKSEAAIRLYSCELWSCKLACWRLELDASRARKRKWWEKSQAKLSFSLDSLCHTFFLSLSSRLSAPSSGQAVNVAALDLQCIFFFHTFHL